MGWKEIAIGILEREQEINPFMHPEPTGVLVSWRRGVYLEFASQERSLL